MDRLDSWELKTSDFYVRDSNLYVPYLYGEGFWIDEVATPDKQIKVWHFCEGPVLGLETNPRTGNTYFEDAINEYRTRLFNEETKRFFKDHCDTGDFFEKEFVLWKCWSPAVQGLLENACKDLNQNGNIYLRKTATFCTSRIPLNILKKISLMQSYILPASSAGLSTMWKNKGNFFSWTQESIPMWLNRPDWPGSRGFWPASVPVLFQTKYRHIPTRKTHSTMAPLRRLIFHML